MPKNFQMEGNPPCLNLFQEMSSAPIAALPSRQKCGRLSTLPKHLSCGTKLWTNPFLTGDVLTSDPKLEDGGVEAQYPEMAGLTKRVVPSLNKMKEKILIFEAGANDMAIELTKLAVEGIIEKKYDKKVLASYFLLMDSQEKTIGFSFFLEGRDEPVYYDTRLEVYEKCMDIIEDFAFEELHSPYFLLIDETWAKKTLDTYRNS